MPANVATMAAAPTAMMLPVPTIVVTPPAASPATNTGSTNAGNTHTVTVAGSSLQVPSGQIALHGTQNPGPVIDPFNAQANGFANHFVPHPETANDFTQLLFDSNYTSTGPTRLISYYTLQLTKGKPLSNHQLQNVFNTLKSLSTMGNLALSEAKVGSFSIWRLLKGIVGEGMSVAKPYAFPQPFPHAGTLLMERIQSNSSPEELVNEQLSSSANTESSRSKKRKRSEETQAIDLTDPTVEPYMKNIIRAGAHYKIDDKSLIKPSDISGHNDLEVGSWWPFQLCALRDGAHGSLNGGVGGNSMSGASSIVISGSYGGMNKDYGNIIYYAGSHSHNNTIPDVPHISFSTKWMQRSMGNGWPVRVLRSEKSKWSHAPAVGYRYDGLYDIMKEEVRLNSKGGAYVRFKLKRQSGQAEIDTSRPNQAEKEVYKKLKDSAWVLINL